MRICLLLLLWFDNSCHLNAERDCGVKKVTSALSFVAEAEGSRAVDSMMTVAEDTNNVVLKEADGNSSVLLCPAEGPLSLLHFTLGKPENLHCYHRQMRAGLSVVDMHLHARPFGGPAVAFKDLMEILKASGVLFTVLNGIGQRLPIDSPCTYYLDPKCLGGESGIVTPKTANDVVNAQLYLDWKEQKRFCSQCGPYVVLSMTFPDLAKPEEMAPGFDMLMHLYPNMFKWAGEVNVVKQALWKNDAGKPVNENQIDAWAPFMSKLREHNMPLALHCDVGNNENPSKFLHLMKYILNKYGQTNTIIWVHLGGLSKELEFGKADNYEMHHHAALVESMLSNYSKLMIDLSWTVLFSNVWYYKDTSQVFIDMVNRFPERFLPGSDFVAAVSKGKEEYNYEHVATGFPYLSISDEAFRRIALGQNFFKTLGIDSTFKAPKVCPQHITPQCIEYAQEQDADYD